MKSMLILSKCMELKAKIVDLGFELKILICLVVIVLALSLFKALYYHFNSTNNVRKIRQMLENSRNNWRSADHTSSSPVSPLPTMQRVPACLSLRRRNSINLCVKNPANQSNSDSNSSNESVQQTKTLIRSNSSDSLKQMQLLKPDTPPSRRLMKSSTSERAESPPRTRKNQIIAAEMLM